MQAVILAAGKSTRTYPLTLTVPKPLLKAANVTIIENTLEQLNGLVDEAIIIVGYLKEQIKEKIGLKYKKIKIIYIEQIEQNGSGAALLLSKSILKEKFIVMNGDDFYSKKDLEKCIEHRYCVLTKEVDDIRKFGEVITKKGKVVEIREKPDEERKGNANTGVYVFDTSIFKYALEKSQRGEIEIIDYVKRLIEHKIHVDLVTSSGLWVPIAYPWELLDANEKMVELKKKEILGTIEKGATLKGKVCVGKGTVIRSGSYIIGPAIIGENCTIGPNCFIRPCTTIGNYSKVGNAVEIKNSIIGDKTSIGHLSYVGDSIIGNNVNLGAGTITANLRHDSKNVKSKIKGELIDSKKKKLGAIIADDVHTGIHTSIYPGRKIWPNKTTLPGEIVKEDIE